MRTFSLKTLLVSVAVVAVVLVLLGSKFRFQYPVVDSGYLMDGEETLVVNVHAGENIIRQIEVPEYQLNDSKTHVVKKMTPLEFVMFEWKRPVFELNPVRPTH